MALYQTPSFEFAEDEYMQTQAVRKYVVDLVGATYALFLETWFPNGATSCDILDNFTQAGLAIASADQAYQLAAMNSADRDQFALAA